MTDDRDQGYYDGSKYRFPEKMTQSYIDGWWEGKEDRDIEDCDQFLVFEMEEPNGD
jgi:hypothetical protein